jgi:hypothetical protein
MKIFHELRIAEISDDDLVVIFQDKFSQADSTSDCFVRFKNNYGYFPVKSMRYDRFLEGWEIINLVGEKIGQINHTIYSTGIVLTFEISGDKHATKIQKLVEELQKEIKFIGAKIENARHFSRGRVVDENGKVIRAPIREETLVVHRDAYKIIKNMRKEEKEKFENSDSDVVNNPSIPNLRDRVNHELTLGYSDKTISRIIDEGDAGLLE